MQEIRKGIILDKDILYFDFTASGLAYEPIENEIHEILKRYANTHSEVASNAITMSEQYAHARTSMRESLQVDESFYIMPCGTGATAAIKKFQEILGLYIPPKTRARYPILARNLPIVLVGPYEHHSNEISFREGLCQVVRVLLDQDKNIDLTDLEKKLEAYKNREIIASFSVASNVTGILSDYKSIYKLVKRYNGLLCLDAAAASPYINIDCNFYDALFLSPHKLLGGVGSCGILVIKKELCDIPKPTFAGGGTVAYVSRMGHEYLSDMELLEDAGTPGILQFIRAALAYKLRNDIGLEKIHALEEELKRYFGLQVRQMQGVKLYCSYTQEKLPIFSLNFTDISPYDIAKYLSDHYKIQTRAGCACAGPYGHDLLDLEDGQEFEEKPGWLRISIHYTHTKEQIDSLLKALQEAIVALSPKS